MIPFPVIQNFDALLLLLNEPEKVKGYLNAIKGYRDEIKASLDIVTTVEQARKIAQDAVNTRAAAEQYDAQVRAAIAKEREQLDGEVSLKRSTLAGDTHTVEVAMATLHSEQAKFEDWRKSVEADITAHRTSLSAKEQELSTRESAVSVREQVVEVKRKKMEAALA